MFIVGAQLGSYVSINANVVGRLEEIYQAAQFKHRAADNEALEDVKQYVQELATASAQTDKTQESTTDDGAAETPPDGKDANSPLLRTEKRDRKRLPLP
jgi:hypothetical protein